MQRCAPLPRQVGHWERPVIAGHVLLIPHDPRRIPLWPVTVGEVAR
jgi:hypothetical protein